MIHAFGECELDDERFELRRRGKAVKLEPKVFDVLAYLVRHAERVVTKSELLDAVWAGVNVSESVLPKCIAAVRRAVGDTRARANLIQTVHGRGYRLVAEVRARAASALADAAPGSDPADSSYVGRVGLRAGLTHALDEACAGRGRLIVLMGEPGIGKTRTAEALLGEARRRSLAVAIGRAYEGDTAPAFWPWVQLLRGVAALPTMRAWLAEGGVVGPEVSTLVPELAARSTAKPSAPPDQRPPEGEDARFRLFDAVSSVLKRAAERQPLVLLLDDLQWADAASLRLLALVATEIGTMPLLMVATCRDDEIDRTAALAELMGTLARASTCEWIPLTGLGREETAALVERLVTEAPSAALMDTIHAMTAGNPFFIQETARLLTVDGAATVTDPAALSQSLPRRVRDAVRRRLAKLSPECRTLLRIASVLGPELDAGTLAAVADLPPERTLRLLSEGRAAHLLDAGDLPTRYVFHHALIRHALYDELDDAERVRWHGRAGEHIAALAGADLDASVDAVAHHCFAAVAGGGVARAVEACVRAARRADRLFAYEQSARWYERALVALESAPAVDDAPRVDLLLALGEMRAAAGERDPAREVFFRAAAIARQLARPDLLARAALGYRGPSEMGSPSDPPAIALLEEALAAVGDAFPALRARLLSRMTGCAPWADTMATRIDLSREALVLARESAENGALRDALSARLWASQGPDHVDERLAVGRDLLAFGRREGGLPMTLLAHDAAFGAYLLRGEHGGRRARARRLWRHGGRDEAAGLPLPRDLLARQPAARARRPRRRRADVPRRPRARAQRGARTRTSCSSARCTRSSICAGLDDDPELDRVFFGEMMALPYAFEPALQSALAFALWLRGEHEAAREQFERVAARVAAGTRARRALAGDARRSQPRSPAPRRRAARRPPLRPAAAVRRPRRGARPACARSASRSRRCSATSALVLGRFDEGARHYERGARQGDRHGHAARVDRHPSRIRPTARGSRRSWRPRARRRPPRRVDRRHGGARHPAELALDEMPAPS